MKSVRSRAPLRLGLAGGGTDLSPYCDEHVGYVLNATIDRYTYCSIDEVNGSQVIFHASDHGTRQILEVDDFPFNISGNHQLLIAVYNRMINTYNNGRPIALSISTFCDSPVGSGLGTSSSLVVSIIKSFDEFFMLGLDDYEIANLAFEIERVDCKLEGGRQDQYAATFGGFNFMEFHKNNKVLVNPLRIRNWVRCELESSLLLQYTGSSRSSAAVISNQVENIKNNSKSLQNMHNLKQSALEMKEAILRGDFAKFVDITQTAWINKKSSSSKVSNGVIDTYIERALDAGASCAKVSGAGGGGFIMYFVPIERRQEVISAISYDGSWISNCHFTMEGSQCWTIK